MQSLASIPKNSKLCSYSNAHLKNCDWDPGEGKVEIKAGVRIILHTRTVYFDYSPSTFDFGMILSIIINTIKILCKCHQFLFFIRNSTTASSSKLLRKFSDSVCRFFYILKMIMIVLYQLSFRLDFSKNWIKSGEKALNLIPIACISQRQTSASFLDLNQWGEDHWIKALGITGLKITIPEQNKMFFFSSYQFLTFFKQKRLFRNFKI